MPSKLQTYMQMADEAQRQITGSYRGWTGFLTTAARLYKYPYAEQVMIHAQRPDATACAEYDFWNEKMGRYVRRGSKGIALIDSSGERPRLRYVFDVSDTGGREFPKSRYLWEYREEHADAVSAMLESRYGVDGKGGDAAACIPRFQSAKKIGRRIGGLLWVGGEKPKARELVNGGVLEQAKLRIRNALTRHNLHIHPDALAGMGHLLIRLGNIGFFLLLSRKQADFAHHAEQTFWAAGVPAPPQAVP